MKKIRVLAFGKLLLAALGISLIVVGIAHAQLGVPTFTGKFRLINPVLWGKAAPPHRVSQLPPSGGRMRGAPGSVRTIS